MNKNRFGVSGKFILVEEEVCRVFRFSRCCGKVIEDSSTLSHGFKNYYVKRSKSKQICYTFFNKKEESFIENVDIRKKLIG